jgi:hypothetical protein
MQPRILCAGVVLALAACGGGGGDPGTCKLLPEACGDGQSATTTPATTTMTGSTAAVAPPAPSPGNGY